MSVQEEKSGASGRSLQGERESVVSLAQVVSARSAGQARDQNDEPAARQGSEGL